MTLKEVLFQELNGLQENDLEKVVEYVKFLKVKHIFMPIKKIDEKDYASLYSEFADEDRELAEEGISDFNESLNREDNDN
jgi:hypothetical protein